MAKFKVVYDKEHCSSANKCMAVQPNLWGKDENDKAILNNGALNPKTGKYELLIDQDQVEFYKESALICPVYVIDILEVETNKSLLNIKPTKEEDKDKVPVLKAHYDSRKEWKMDPKGFFTFKPFPEENLIRARYYGEDHALKFVIEGDSAEKIYNTIVREGLVSTFQHAAYVGCELMKAEIAMQKNLLYVQDDPLS